MAMEYTEEQLNKFDKATIVQLFLAQQSQLKDIDNKLQLVLEQLAVMNNHRFGNLPKNWLTDNQIAFLEVNGELFSSTKQKLSHPLLSMMKRMP